MNVSKCPNAPMKGKNPNPPLVGFKISKKLFFEPQVKCPDAPKKKKKRVQGFLYPEPVDLFNKMDEGYETPDDQKTKPRNLKPQRKKY